MQPAKALIDVGIDRSFISSEIGKTIFFSEEAANKALEEEVKKTFEEAEFMQRKKGE